MQPFVVPFEQLRLQDIETVGGKNASLGEMINNLSRAGVKVPGGFATTADAYRAFLAHEGLADRIDALLGSLDTDNLEQLAATGKQIRTWLLEAPLPAELEAEIVTAWEAMSAGQGDEFSVAVRSSATAEDLPDASFAGQQETLLNVRGLDNLLSAVREVFASLYTDRAIAYREHQGFDHKDVALSVGVQRMVRSDLACSGVMFTLDTDSGFRDVVFITSSWGLGECVVQGAVNPDEFYVYKPALRANRHSVIRRNLGSKAIKMVYNEDPAANEYVQTIDVSPADSARFSLSDADIETLSRYALSVEEHYGRPMDIEWARLTVSTVNSICCRPDRRRSRAAQTSQCSATHFATAPTSWWPAAPSARRSARARQKSSQM